MTKEELREKANDLPLLPGVYLMMDKTGKVIYVGKAKKLKNRVSQYFQDTASHNEKTRAMVSQVDHFDTIFVSSEFEALILENSLIKRHQPRYNILLKDDKGYSYIKVTKDEWPRLSFTLQKEDDGAEYIGPYTSSFAARQMAETAMDAFLLPRCSRRFPQEIGRGRPCLNAHIGKCMAVCSGKISRENYEQAVKSAVHLIRYGKKDILKTLNERMLEASDRLEFETAALIRDQIAAITKVTAGQKVVVDPDVEMDVVALAGTPGSVCAAVLRFREGRLTDKREFLFHDTADIAAVREEFLPRYYLDDEQIPKVIAVDELPPDVDALQQALNEKRGSEVQLYVPQRGDKAHLVEMAHTNAVERLARESGRYAREEKLLDELAQVLGLPKPPRTIESYDISNWGDGTSVCGMVTFRDGKPYKAGYRKFKMKTVAGTDDYASLAETVNDVYETLPHRREDFRWVIDNTHDTLCFNCGRRDTCWKQEYAATLEGMEALRPLLESSGGLETAQLPGQLSRCIHPAALCAAANRSFALYRSRKEARLHAEAMRTALTEQYSAVAEALGVLGEQLGRPGDPEPYKSGRVADFFAQLGTPPQECAVTLDDLGRTHAAVTLPRTRFSAQELAALAGEVGRICRRTLEVPQVLSCKGMTTLLFSEKPVLRAVFGMAGAAARGSISGDAVQQFCSPAAAQMILCDGMGTGRPAAVDGNLAAELTARLLKAGFTAELAARLVNVALALKSEDESGATLDLISVDLYTGTARLFKAGAAPGFLVHGGRVRAVGDTSLPVGILGGVNGQSRVVHLTVGDYAVLVSDGLLVDGPGWVAKQLELSAAAGDAPEKVAKTLVETARVRAQKTGRPDDITAAVLRLENGG